MSVFKDKSTTEDVKAADDPQWAIATAQVPSDDPTVFVPSQFRKRKWPAPTENLKRPRYGHDY